MQDFDKGLGKMIKISIKVFLENQEINLTLFVSMKLIHNLPFLYNEFN